MVPQPKETPHIFISHSHADIENGNFYFLIGFLKKKFGINCFIDAWEWGDYRELLNIIYNLYKTEHEKDPSYEIKRIISTKIEALLLRQLYNMMDKTETIFFLESHNSNPQTLKTNSSWIYLENAALSFLRRTEPQRRLQFATEDLQNQEEREQYFINKFFFTLKDLPKLTYKDIREWHKASSTSTSDAEGALDKLYDLYPAGLK